VSKYLIALDDGHGMETAGKRTPKFADGSFMHENEFNKAVVNKVAKKLEKYIDIEVMFTAPTDKDTPLRERSSLANKIKADILISVHANAFDGYFKGADPSGVSTHIYTNPSKDTLRLAQCVHKNLIKGTTQFDRGILKSNFHILRETNMPAILIESAFMDNIREARLLRTEEFRAEVATEIVQGILEYFNIKEKIESTIYNIKIGPYSNRDNALEARTRLKSLGYDAIIVADK
jgi:N-acetylmuramoyl-L-alanine amidase